MKSNNFFTFKIKFEYKGAVQQNFKENTGLWGGAEKKNSQEEQFKRQDCRKTWGWELGGGTRIKKVIGCNYHGLNLRGRNGKTMILNPSKTHLTSRDGVPSSGRGTGVRELRRKEPKLPTAEPQPQGPPSHCPLWR